MSIYTLHLRSQEQNGPVTSGTLYRLAESGLDEIAWNHYVSGFTQATRNENVIVFVHGYNNDRSKGRERLTHFARLLGNRSVGHIKLLVLWPGDGPQKALSYPFEARDADDSANMLAKWLLTNVHGSATIDLVAHSLGCRVAMNTAQQIATSTQLKKPQLGNICLMAAALDNNCLGSEGKARYRQATINAKRISVLASRQDDVLRLAYPLGDLTHSALHGERWGCALGRTGPKEHEAEILARLYEVPVALPGKSVDHKDYLDSKEKNATQQDRTHTMSYSDVFAAAFLRGEEAVWPATIE